MDATGRGGAALGRVRRLRRRRWIDHAVRAAVRYRTNRDDHYAVAVAFFSVLALPPLLMIGFSVTGFVLFWRPALATTCRTRSPCWPRWTTRCARSSTPRSSSAPRSGCSA